ncbi:SDR family oxidoreductase [Paenibacillus kobensis]|uniref:SDR family oxidoreductase n=1 Tax=Paenibacillus kobensis TaxID=59841 RepID=UPI000FDB9B99|nr:SDR family oxidoreductase [Paenibacillus kobensis]
MELKGRTALITGSAKGLGKRAAMELARQGCSIVLNYNTSEREARALQEELRQFGVRTEAIQADITIPDETERLAEEAEAWAGGIDILINNAGPFIRERRLFGEYDRNEITALVNGNLLSVMLLDHRLLSGMRARGWGRIIHFGFGHAGEARSWPHRAVYAAAKTGLVSFTKTLAAEEAAYGITVNMICPGDIRGVNKERSIEEAITDGECELPLGRPGTGEDVSRVIAFLCHSRSDYLTGNLIDVNGGFDPIVSKINRII